MDTSIKSSNPHPFAELQRVSRILELAAMVAAAPHRYLRRDLARRFEVSERMIQKDLDVIRNGLKLTLQHDSSGYFFESIPRLPTLQYSFAEALALLMAIQPAVQMNGSVQPELAAALARLEALFPPELTRVLRQAALQPVKSAQRNHRAQMLRLLNQAMLFQQKIHIDYETRSRGGATSERIVRPYAILPYVRSYQLIAYCEKREAVLMFKVDRILRAELLEARYCIPADFQVEAYLGDTWGMMRGTGGEPQRVTLRFERDTGHRVAEEHWHASQEFTEEVDGSVLMRLCVPLTPEFVHWILYYGSEVEVVEPEGLREMLVNKALALMRVYKVSKTKEK